MDNDIYKTPDAPLMRDDLPVQTAYAGFWIRVLASIIDTILILIITMPLSFLIYGENYMSGESAFLGVGDILINYLFPFIAVILFWTYKSATPGKMIVGIKIIDAITGQKPSTGKFIGRYFAYIPASIVFGLGLLWVAWDKKKQGWHDKLAKTLVVKSR